MPRYTHVTADEGRPHLHCHASPLPSPPVEEEELLGTPLPVEVLGTPPQTHERATGQSTPPLYCQ